jgi:hypothetical protein
MAITRQTCDRMRTLVHVWSTAVSKLRFLWVCRRPQAICGGSLTTTTPARHLRAGMDAYSDRRAGSCHSRARGRGRRGRPGPSCLGRRPRHQASCPQVGAFHRGGTCLANERIRVRPLKEAMQDDLERPGA